MRRSAFVKLIGISEEIFNVVRTRKLLPLRGRDVGKGWQDFSVEDALAFEAASALARLGITKAEARDVVDTYFEIALERAAEAPTGQPVYLGLAKTVVLFGGQHVSPDYFPLVGSAIDLAEEINRLTIALGDSGWVDGTIAANLNLCMATIYGRAEKAGVNDSQLEELAVLFALRLRGV